MGKAIKVENITKRFGDLCAVDSISYEVNEGECFGLLGPNGAGKTTLIRMLTTLLKPTNGTAFIEGYDINRNPDAVRKNIGVVPQAMTSDLDLTAWENMEIYGKYYQIPKKIRQKRIGELLDMVGLINRKDDLVATYSGGMRRRLEIARGLIHNPPIIFLDEPTLGLDPQGRRLVWEFLQRLRKERGLTLSITTHYMEEAEFLCDRVAIIDYGKIVALDTPMELKRNIPGSDIITITFDEVTKGLKEWINGLPSVHRIIEEFNDYQIYIDNGASLIPRLVEEVNKMGRRIVKVSLRELTLEDVFIHYTGRSIREEEAKKISFLIGAGVPQKFSRG
ncbi:MAG: ATP-binding cassette domain-containing protein [Nitrospinae bacterium]|nr:ATP-binding cassette domain-containing protein [Nitrospinota bacterium]